MHSLTIFTKPTFLLGKETHLNVLYHRRGWGLVAVAVLLLLLMLNDVVVLYQWGRVGNWSEGSQNSLAFKEWGGKTDCFWRR